MPAHTHAPTVILDPGHGGTTRMGSSSPTGTRGPGGTLEKDVTLRLARMVADQLGAGAVLTRDRDINLSLSDRADLARRRDARVFLSIHANGDDARQRGAEAYVHHRGGPASQSLARTLLRELRAGGDARGAELAVLTPERLGRGSAACLLEVDYLSHPDGERRLRDPGALAELARAICRGVRSFLAQNPAYGAADEGDGEFAGTDETLENGIAHEVPDADASAGEEYDQGLAVTHTYTTNIPSGFTLQGSNHVGTIHGISVTIQPDSTDARAVPAGSAAVTKISSRVRTPGFRASGGSVTHILGSATLAATIHTIYRTSTGGSASSGYGRGTCASDVAAGNTSLRFHESCHGQDYLDYMTSNAPPVFGGHVGQSVADFQAAAQTFLRDAGTYFNSLEQNSKDVTDCVCTKASFCP